MRSSLLLLILLPTLFLAGCSGESKQLEREQLEMKQQLEALGEPVVSQTVPQIGATTQPQISRPGTAEKIEPTAPKWMQVDLGETSELTQVVLIPVQIDWHRMMHPTYNFPARFRVDLSDDPDCKTSVPIGVFVDADFPNPGLSPLILPAAGKRGRYLRITVFGVDSFALAEVMALKGNRNIAIGCPVQSSGIRVSEPSRWDPKYLVDGWTPLGPPILYEALDYDGLFIGHPESDSPVRFQLDLGRNMPIEEVRLYGVHGRTGVDLPGYRFPKRFRVESATDEQNWQVLFETLESFSNPGNNVVTIPTPKAHGRYVRVTLITDGLQPSERRFGLSEIAVYSNGENVARKATVAAVNDPGARRKDWPESILVDGCTSFGRILELPEWLENWTKRRELTAALERLNARQGILLAQAERRQWIIVGGLGMLFVGAIGAVVVNTRRTRRRELDLFRKGLTQDLHDEVGSNLAAIGMISGEGVESPTPLGQDAWNEIFRISRETTDAMRETLWLAGGHIESNLNLMEHLKLTATRMMPNRSVEWKCEVNEFPPNWGQEARRQVFLFFKETLANVVRHSRATAVVLSARLTGSDFELEICDNGQGFSPRETSGGIGLGSLRERARRLGGTMEINAEIGKGTRVVLRAKLDPRP